MNCQPYLQAHYQSPTGKRTDQSFVKELAKPTQEKLFLKNLPPLQKKSITQSTADTTLTRKLNADNCLQARPTKHQLPKEILPSVGFNACMKVLW